MVKLYPPCVVYGALLVVCNMVSIYSKYWPKKNPKNTKNIVILNVCCVMML